MADVVERVLRSRLTCAGIPLQTCDGYNDANKWVGIGCQRGVSKLAIQQAIESVLTEHDLDLATIAGIATVDRKANEVGLLDYCRQSGLFLKTYRPERLNSVIVDRPSRSVSELVGTASVAEAAALCAAQTKILLVPKQKFRIAGNGVTVAIAQIDRNLA
jgi:cobalt-precorrin 5A hydrolase